MVCKGTVSGRRFGRMVRLVERGSLPPVSANGETGCGDVVVALRPTGLPNERLVSDGFAPAWFAPEWFRQTVGWWRAVRWDAGAGFGYG